MSQLSTDSPLKKTSVMTMTSARPTVAKDVVAAVHQDLDGAVGVTTAADFMNKLLKVDQKVLDFITPRILKQLYDNRARRWREFPMEDEAEGNFYRPFVNLANTVISQIQNYSSGPAAANRAQGTWVDCHSKAPVASDKYCAEIRPDCAFVSNAPLITALTADEDDQQEIGKKHPRKKAVSKKARVCWRHILIPVEVKRNDRDHVGIFPQLCTYVRQIFREQLDRRFVFGITLTFNQVAIWLCDRSGGLGMSTCYNINKNPEKFIHILASASLLSGPQLGWDPTLRLFDSEAQNFDFSYRIRPFQSDPKLNLSESKWLLSLVDEEKNKVHKILLVGCPLLFRTAEGMNGRAVHVHRGFLEEDKDKPYRRPLVIKTSWQPVSKLIENENSLQSHEAYHYSLVKGIRDRIFAASVVKADHGRSDIQDSSMVSTFECIRQGVEMDFKKAEEINKKMGAKPANELDETDELLAFMMFNESAQTPDHIRFAENTSRLTNRVQTRLVMDVWGWPVKFFKDRKEFLTTMLGSIKDHKKMYDEGLLHRDVSAGNILIQPGSPSKDKDLRASVSTTHGILIDLDHAKYTTYKTVPGEGVKVRSSDYLREEVRYLRRHDLDVKEDIVTQGLKLLTNPRRLVSYVEEAMKRNVRNSSPNGLWSAEDFGWKDIGGKPNFASHQPTVTERTGTIPFISHKLMNPDKNDIHEAIHDLESFWWIIVYFCLTRKSGGAHRRDDFTEGLVNIVNCLFQAGNDTIGFRKSNCFSLDDDEPFERLLGHFHKYFEPLKPMLRRWRNVLILGYTFKAYEYYRVHDLVIEIIQDALRTLPAEPAETLEVIEQELQRREKEYSFLCNTPPSNLHAPHESPPTSPISVASGGFSPPRPSTRRPHGPQPPPATPVAQGASASTGQFQTPPQYSQSPVKPPSKKPRNT